MEQNLTVGKTVKIIKLPDYLKTADSMPMLRPATALVVGEEGIIVDRRPGGYWSVLFPNRGAFLLDSQYLEVVTK
jgi:hypothetical protein